FLFLFLPILGTAQISDKQQQELAALNNYLHFANESTHGLLTAHRLLETFNQKVNKYVDLESKQLNFYSNADLPADIFEDPEHWFYDVSPYTWHDRSMAGGKILPPTTAGQLRKEMDKMREIIKRVNAIRFDLEGLTKEEDLKEKKNLAQIYKTLEEVVTLYDDYNVAKKRLKRTIQKRYAALNIVNEDKDLGNIIAIHENIRAFLEGVRAEDNNNLTALVQHLKNNLGTAKSFNITDRSYLNVLQKAEAFAAVAQKYVADEGFPITYKLYGRTYYYYNMEMVAKFNRYGSGLVKDLNEWVASKNYPALVQLEEPHFFKVIYPKKEVPKLEEVETIKPKSLPGADVPKVETIDIPKPRVTPKKDVPKVEEAVVATIPKNTSKDLDERVNVIKQQEINVSPGSITIGIYDHQLADGDIISLNYNGHWVLKNYQLRRVARKMTLPLEPGKENYLILHAENLGAKPPNTVTLSYTYNGEKKHIVMESDLDESEMIKINVQE
ncbi:MAG: hypothetical protein AB8G86_06695, partial [Saprospiraceae bacterium]